MTPITRLMPTKHECNKEIRRRHQQGESLSGLAQVFGITEHLIYQIVQGQRNRFILGLEQRIPIPRPISDIWA